MSHAQAITKGYINKLYAEDGAAHEWYRFVLSFPPHLVRHYVEQFGLTEESCVLDPFCGTGTTLVECAKLGIQSIGLEATPMAHFATQTKTDWSPEPDGLIEHALTVAQQTSAALRAQGIEDEWIKGAPPQPASHQPTRQDDHTAYRSLPSESFDLLLTNSISPLPLHKTLVLLEQLKQHQDERYVRHELLALAKALVFSISNLHFGPEVGVSRPKSDATVIYSWMENVRAMANDLRELKMIRPAASTAYHADARQINNILPCGSIDAVITSPPYPNEKDYTRTTRLETVLLGFIKNKVELRALKQRLLRSNTRNVYKSDDDDQWIAGFPEVQRLSEIIEARRIELGRTSGFERLYARVTRLYFGGLVRHLAELREVLRPGAYLAYVVGDQASYFRVLIRTGRLLAELAQSLGYQVEGIDLFRSRLSTATREQLREEVVLLRWPEKIASRIVSFTDFQTGKNSMVKGKDSKSPPNRYLQIIERIFFAHYEEGAKEILFERGEIEGIAAELKINLPKNLGDIVYSFRYRTALPESIRAKAGAGQNWIIRPAGRSKYCFALVPEYEITPNRMLAETKVPDSTPGLVAMYSLDDEQALLARLRYNHLIDIFTGITCYSLQNHLRTSLPGIGQVETDEVYIGVDRKGMHYVFPVQAKGGRDKLNIVQIEQDFALCASKFPNLICRPIGAQFVAKNLIALFEFESSTDGIKLAAEKHYQLVPPDEVTPEILQTYKDRLSG